jgi:hypothetical protein
MNINDLKKEIKLLIYELTGNKFEDFVVKIYKIEYGNQFIKVKPDGNIGDLANDGYVQNKILIQVYAPEIPKTSEAINKISRDYERAKNNWKFKEWHFVYNDKFNGITTRIVKHVNELNEKEDIKLKLIASDDLMNKILSLAKNKPFEIFIILNKDTEIENFDDFEKLSSVIDFLANTKDIKNNPLSFFNFSQQNFFQGKEEKIKLNIKDEEFRKKFQAIVIQSRNIIPKYQRFFEEKLSEVGDYIKQMYYNFKNNYSPEESIKLIMNNLINDLKNNQHFDKNIELATYIIVGYFFDICDIGETPNGNGK